MLDTGGGDIGKLTIMNVDTLEWWQSNKKSNADEILHTTYSEYLKNWASKNAQKNAK
jgi:hypothetical protein